MTSSIHEHDSMVALPSFSDHPLGISVGRRMGNELNDDESDMVEIDVGHHQRSSVLRFSHYPKRNLGVFSTEQRRRSLVC